VNISVYAVCNAYKETTLTISSNDPDEAAKSLTVRCKAPQLSGIKILPSSIMFVNWGKTKTAQLEFSNSGSAPLNYSISIPSTATWLSGGGSGSVGAGQTISLPLTYTCTDEPSDLNAPQFLKTFDTNIVLNTNSPNNPTYPVFARLYCGGVLRWLTSYRCDTLPQVPPPVNKIVYYRYSSTNSPSGEFFVGGLKDTCEPNWDSAKNYLVSTLNPVPAQYYWKDGYMGMQSVLFEGAP
jgi:hypothetical protein